eukprot:6600738-Prymnesium_polylepis.1
MCRRALSRVRRSAGDRDRGVRVQDDGPARGGAAARRDGAAVLVLPATVHLRPQAGQVVPGLLLQPADARQARAGTLQPDASPLLVRASSLALSRG